MTPCSLQPLHADSAVSIAAADGHEHDLVMPGFRFHPTEEELIDFYLRRKVEGRRFNVDLITFLDLYRFDPWELPALAAIGEKEWFFYVPRDRKYRNGDRPNRVTASGYWKATGADRVIRSENGRRSIGLKKTLVFYSGKAPRGVRSSWIMNEYRLPHSDTDRFRKVEISLCRVYKRPGLEDHPRTTVTNSRQSSAIREDSSSSKLAEISTRKLRPTATAAMDPPPKPSPLLVVYGSRSAASVTSLSSTTTSTEEDNGSTSFPMITTSNNNNTTTTTALTLIASSSPSNSSHMMDELNRLVSLNHSNNSNNYMSSNSNSNNNVLHLQPNNLQIQHHVPLNALPMSVPTVSDINSKLWEWNYNTLQELYTDEMK